MSAGTEATGLGQRACGAAPIGAAVGAPQRYVAPLRGAISKSSSIGPTERVAPAYQGVADNSGHQDPLTKGQAMIAQGREAEDKGNLQSALDCYRKGLKKVIAVLGKLSEDDPRTASTRHMVSEYLERSEKVKRKVDRLPS